MSSKISFGKKRSKREAEVSKKVENKEQLDRRINGPRNLFILLILSVAISLSLTTVSLAVYHYSGDIYLDRSRPGFLPDDEEIEEEEDDEEGEYSFLKSGAVTKEVLEEYLKKIQIEVNALNEYSDPFDAGALSNEQFGI